MEIGKPDFDTPKAIKRREFKPLRKALSAVCASWRIFRTKKPLPIGHREKYGLEYDPESELLITVGASEAGFIWFGADYWITTKRVMIPSPYYGSYVYQVVSADAKYVEVPVLKDGDI